jgi:2-alkyl-3-oxoalkanoate reductase
VNAYPALPSSEHGLQTLKRNGAEGVIANALDAQAVEAAAKRVQPDAVVEELTSLPKHYTPEEMRAAADRDRTARLEGGRNVQNAARAAGAPRYIVQSTGFFYAPGPGLATEADPLALDASPPFPPTFERIPSWKSVYSGRRICKVSRCATGSFTDREPGSRTTET